MRHTLPTIMLCSGILSLLLPSQNSLYDISKHSLYHSSQQAPVLANSATKFANAVIPSPSNYVEDYFIHLKDNFPNNIDGICGYTAISMLLSYYDTYWNDSIIEAKYHSDGQADISTNYTSPGVKDITIQLSYYLRNDEYYKNTLPSQDYEVYHERCYLDYIDANINSGSFLGKLFETSKSAGNLKSHYETNVFLNSLGVNYNIEKSILDKYISSFTFLSLDSKNTQSDKCSINEIRNNIISYIEKGEPVIVGGDVRGESNENIGGHVCIAYAYDKSTDTIYGNLGWGANYVYTNLDKYFLSINDYYHLTLSSSSKHTHNEKYYNPNKGSVCSCQLSTHKHSYKFSSIDSKFHGYLCFCNQSINKEEHDFYYTTYYGGAPWKECKVCEYGAFAYSN